MQLFCEDSGLAFEAPNRRRKLHPTIAAWKAQAHEEGWYHACLDAIRQGREQGFTTIEQFNTLFETTRTQALSAQAERNHARFEQERAAKEARRRRATTNALLAGRGYCWRRYENDEEDVDLLHLPEVEWHLIAPDGRQVSVVEAMQELAWQGVAFAKTWLAEEQIPERKPEIIKQHEAEEEQARKEIAQLSPQNQQYQREAEIMLRSMGLSPHEALLKSVSLSKPHAIQDDYVRLAEPVWIRQSQQLVELVMDSDLTLGLRINHRWYGAREVLSNSIPEERQPPVPISQLVPPDLLQRLRTLVSKGDQLVSQREEN